MVDFVFANNASSVLAASITSLETVIEVAAGTGGRFPDPVQYSEQFTITLKSLDTNESEIVYCVERNGDFLNILRAQEGTVALSFGPNDAVVHTLTAGALEFIRDF
ncbi:MAG: hypothetical protein KAJ55_08965 [Anaerolineales bacterium]|nr:hypothetical protein [Anaerolineales bacterium]